MGKYGILMLGNRSRCLVGFISYLLHHEWRDPGSQCTGNWMQPTANLVMVARRKNSIYLFCIISFKWPTASHYTKLYKEHAVGSSTYSVTSPGDGTTSWGSYSSEYFHCNMHKFKLRKFLKMYTKLIHISGCTVQGHVQAAFRYQQMRFSTGRVHHNIFKSARACTHTHKFTNL